MNASLQALLLTLEELQLFLTIILNLKLQMYCEMGMEIGYH